MAVAEPSLGLVCSDGPDVFDPGDTARTTKRVAADVNVEGGRRPRVYAATTAAPAPSVWRGRFEASGGTGNGGEQVECALGVGEDADGLRPPDVFGVGVSEQTDAVGDPVERSVEPQQVACIGDDGRDARAVVGRPAQEHPVLCAPAVGGGCGHAGVGLDNHCLHHLCQPTQVSEWP